MLLGPTTVNTVLGNCKVRVQCETNYPFSEDLTYKIHSECAFDFGVRVPEWTAYSNRSATAVVGGSQADSLQPDSNGVHHFSVTAGASTIHFKLPMEVHTVTRNGSVGIYRGPLLYAADIAHSTTSHQPLNWTDLSPLADSEIDHRCRDHVLEPAAPWQYAVDPSSARVEHSDRSIAQPAWESQGQNTVLSVDAYPIAWPETLGTADVPPQNPTVDRGAKTSLRLIPFGAAKLHIAQFPVAVFIN